MLCILVLAMCAAGTAAVGVQSEPISKEAAGRWIQHLTPLPHEVSISAQVTLPTEQIAVSSPGISMPLALQGASELREALGSGTIARQPAFTLTLQLGGPEAESLRNLKNANQAYRILPEEDNTGLRLVALAPPGVYYACKTLQQLVRAGATDSEVVIPILRVTDWPDMADRGVWGTDTPFHIRWLSDRKFNYMEQVASHSIDDKKHSVVTMNESRRRMIDEGPSHGIQPVPAIVHLERLGSKGVFEAYPALKGRGEGVHEGAACYSHPGIVDVLADWIVGCARLPGVTQVDVWMTENLAGKPGCQCDKCRGKNRDLLEAGVIVAAWNKARAEAPNIGLRVLTSEETADSNEQILEMLPPEVAFWYYHSLLTYSNRKMEIIPPYATRWARRGRRIGVVVDIGVKWRLLQPFTGAHFIHYRMNEFVDKDIAALMGYPRPRVYYCDFNTEAAAEWSWNAKGRTTRAFAFSWAVRQGLDDPELFAEWSETLGPVAWDVYGSEWPHGETRRALQTVAVQLKQGTLPELGEVLWGVFPKPWGGIPSVARLDEDVANAERALQLARKTGLPRCVEESRAIQGYIRSLKALHELKSLVTSEGIAEENRRAAGRGFQDYVDSLRQVQDAVVKWEEAVGTPPGHPRLADGTAEYLGVMIKDMTQLAVDLGYRLE